MVFPRYYINIYCFNIRAIGGHCIRYYIMAACVHDRLTPAMRTFAQRKARFARCAKDAI